jgi:hypothetical protein
MEKTQRPFPRFAQALRKYHREGEITEPTLYRWARGDFGRTNPLTWLTKRPDVIRALYEDVTDTDGDMLPLRDA